MLQYYYELAQNGHRLPQSSADECPSRLLLTVTMRTTVCSTSNTMTPLCSSLQGQAVPGATSTRLDLSSAPALALFHGMALLADLLFTHYPTVKEHPGPRRSRTYRQMDRSSWQMVVLHLVALLGCYPIFIGKPNLDWHIYGVHNFSIYLQIFL